MGLAILRIKTREMPLSDRASDSSGSGSEDHKPVVMLSNNVRTLCSRVQMLLRQRRRKQQKRVVISAPFNLTREPVSLPGISEDELSMLREKAAASRIGIADPALPRSPLSTSSLFSHPVRAPLMMHPTRGTVSTDSLC